MKNVTRFFSKFLKPSFFLTFIAFLALLLGLSVLPAKAAAPGQIEFDPEKMAVVVGLVAVVNGVVAGLITPIFEKYSLDKFWLMYISWGLAAILIYLARINVFDGIFASDLVGAILTAIAIGRTANLAHDLVDRK